MSEAKNAEAELAKVIAKAMMRADAAYPYDASTCSFEPWDEWISDRPIFVSRARAAIAAMATATGFSFSEVLVEQGDHE